MEKEMNKYLNAVRRRLNMPKDDKDRVMADFISSVQCRLEDGQTKQEIINELGSPKKAAAELNEQMKEYTYKKSPWRWACLALAIFSALCLAYRGLPGLLLMLFNKSYNAASVGVIGGADGPTAIFVTTNATAFPTAGIYVLLLLMGILGFIALRKVNRK